MAEQMLGLALRGWHIAAVAWVSASDEAAHLHAVGRLLAEASGRTPMIVHADAGSIWAWMSFPDRPSFTSIRSPRGWPSTARCASPSASPAPKWPGSGPPTRKRCARARWPRSARSEPDSCIRHAQVALAGLLIDRRDAVRMWVQRTLGQLARDDQSIARLRETLRVLLEANGSYVEAAARMHVHKNTVLYRVRKAEELLGGPSRTDDSPSKLRCSPATNSRQRPRLRYLRPLDHRVEQQVRTRR